MLVASSVTCPGPPWREWLKEYLGLLSACSWERQGSGEAKIGRRVQNGVTSFLGFSVCLSVCFSGSPVCLSLLDPCLSVSLGSPVYLSVLGPLSVYLSWTSSLSVSLGSSVCRLNIFSLPHGAAPRGPLDGLPLSSACAWALSSEVSSQGAGGWSGRGRIL